MNVLVLGANGNLGPFVVRALETEHRLRLADLRYRDTEHEYRKVDVTDAANVTAAAEGMDAIVNLTVVREVRQAAFDVSARGCYNVMAAAVDQRVPLVVNTGAYGVVAGTTYREIDYLIGPDAPPHPGTHLYSLTKSLGQEVCRLFTEDHDVRVIALLIANIYRPAGYSADPDFLGLTPFALDPADYGEAFRCALSTDMNSLPSRCEVFFLCADLPHQKFTNEKAKRLLGWEPRDRLEQIWRKPGKQ